MPIADPTAWHDIWVTIQAGGTETHQVSVYVDNSLVPTTLDITAGDNQNDYSAYNWLGMGHGTTGSPGLGSGAEDVDFLSIKAGVWTPIPEPSVVSLALLGLLGLAARFRSCRRS